MSSAPAGPVPARPKCASLRGKRPACGLVDDDRLPAGGPGGREPDLEPGWLRPPVHDWHCADGGHEWRETG